MANHTFAVSRNQVILGVCLPLAVLVGYFLADPLDSATWALLVMVFTVLSIPILMKWHHPLLVFSVNATIAFSFLPGSLPLWVVVACGGFLFAALNRSVDTGRTLFVGRRVAWSLAALAGVVALTYLLTGGAGARALGSQTYGAKRYLFVAAGILTYFVLASQPVPPERARLYATLYFLSGLTGIVGLLPGWIGGLDFLAYISPTEMVFNAGWQDVFGPGITRISALCNISAAICLALLVRYGIRGLLEPAKPWRALLFLAGFGLGAYSGFRSVVGFIALVAGLTFLLEGLHRTKYLLVVLAMALAAAVGLLMFSTKLPLSVQRAVSFLPIEVHPAAKGDARGSWEWRWEMWKVDAQEVPRYLFKGKGYAMSPQDIYLAMHSDVRQFTPNPQTASVTGTYHNGPLSVLIPFGIWGALALVWFWWAAGRMMYRFYARGPEALKTVNTVLLACFITQVIFFVFLVGGLEVDLRVFAALAGLSYCLNVGHRRQESFQVAGGG